MKPTFLPHLFEAVAREANIGIVVFDPKGECLFINQFAINLLGAEKPTLKQLVPDSERPPLKSFSTDLLKHDGLYQDILLKSATGILIASVGTKLLQVEGWEAHLLMLQDVTLQMKLQREITAKQTQIKAAFEELLKQNHQLKELDLAKNRFIALTTHELRTPLSAMVASAEILKLKLYDTPEQMDEFINMIHEQGNQLQDLVNDILDFAKIQAGKMDIYLDEQSVAPMIEAITHHYQNMAESSSVALTFTASQADCKCYFDEVRLRQVLSNMISNAIKYNRKDGTAHVHCEVTDELVKIYVTDTGKGIAGDQMDKVFNEFETIGHVAQHHKGTGLGMPISRKLTEGMGGKLLVTSIEGQGSTFWVELPRKRVMDESLYQKRPERMGDYAA
jgi:signal transduction histidine kinase